MRRTVFLLLFFLLSGSVSFAQCTNTLTSGTVTDPNGLPYSYGTITADIFPSPPGNMMCGSSGLAGHLGPIQLDANGSFSGWNIPQNGSITPSGTQWTFTVAESPGVAPPAGFGPVSFQVRITITSGTTNLSSTLSAAAPALSRVTGGSGTVTGVTGTTNQITVTPSTPNPTVSLSNSIIFPGTTEVNQTSISPDSTVQKEFDQSLLNGISPATEYFANHSNYATDALTGAVASPNGATGQANAVAGYATTLTNTVVGGYFQTRNLANNTFADGINGVVQDVAGLTTGVQMTGLDIDAYPLNANTAYSLLGGVNIALHASNSGAFGNGYLCQQFGGSVGYWGTCFDSANNATVIGLVLGTRNTSATSSVTSQGIQFNWIDSSSVGHNALSFVDATGALNWAGGGFSCGTSGIGCIFTQYGSSSGSITLTPNAGSTVDTLSSSLSLPVGSASTPALAISGTSQGFFQQASQVLSYAAGSADALSMYQNGIRLINSGAFQWSSNGVSVTAFDTELSRPSAGLISVDTTSAGNAAGMLKASLLLDGFYTVSSGTGHPALPSASSFPG